MVSGRITAERLVAFRELRAYQHESEEANGTTPRPLERTSQLLDGRGTKLEEGPCTGPPGYGCEGRLVPPAATQVE